ncbi:hypothetical protein [Uliginosibacterium sp. TH139]|uniref:hypothetical protein n=1 Tax=Uliginosibacterium sp. TH139 TaxID=2067453 RepID=UPI000C79BC5F|nr:hypothetical protein [Uliginosibacterium sp. TH139]PLK49476.1 hypothetical protein C0V76_09845 [Uliginosibacterium sp. TH139]
MSEPFSFPPDAQYLSEVSLRDETLSVRFKPESVLEPEARAFEFQAHSLSAAQEAHLLLTQLRADNEYIYASWYHGSAVLSAEDGTEVLLKAASFSGEFVELNAAEFREALNLSNRIYIDAHEYGRRTTGKLNRIKELLLEQSRRLSVKAGSHELESTAGVLYAQNIQFLSRLLNEIES